jgi:hypothetical protein
MAAVRSTAWKDRYQHLLSKGLKPIQAITALARKIGVTAFHLFTMRKLFDPKMVALKN